MTPINQILNKKVLLAFSLILSILFFSNFIYAPAITSCDYNITSSGTYWLESDITCDYTDNYFVNSDLRGSGTSVTIDGNGYSVYFQNNNDVISVYPYHTTIKNINIYSTGNGYGINAYRLPVLLGFKTLTVYDSNIYCNNGIYVTALNADATSDYFYIYDNIIDSNQYGININIDSSLIRRNGSFSIHDNIINSNQYGIYLNKTARASLTIYNNNITSNYPVYVNIGTYQTSNNIYNNILTSNIKYSIFFNQTTTYDNDISFSIFDNNSNNELLYLYLNFIDDTKGIDLDLYNNSNYFITFNNNNKGNNIISISNDLNNNLDIFDFNFSGKYYTEYYDSDIFDFNSSTFMDFNNMFDNISINNLYYSDINNLSTSMNISNIYYSNINMSQFSGIINNIYNSSIYNSNFLIPIQNISYSNLFDSNIYKISNIYSSNLENIILSNTLGYVYDTNINILSSISTGNISNSSVSYLTTGSTGSISYSDINNLTTTSTGSISYSDINNLTTTSTGSISYSDISNSNSLLNPTNKDAKITSSNIFNSDINLDYTYLGGLGIKYSSSNMIYDSNIYNSNININNQYNPSVLNNSIVNSSVYDSIITKTGYDLLVPFYNSYISNIDLNHFRLISSDINSCDINNSTIETSDIFNSVFYDINISNSDLIDSNLFINMILSNNTYDNVFAINTSLSDLETSGLGFIDSNVYDSEISDANIFNSDLNNSSFYDCDINGSRFYDLSNDTNIETSNITDSNFIDYVFDTYYTFVNNFYEVIGTLYLDMYDGSDFNTFIFKFVDTNTVIPTTGLTTRYYSYYGSNSPTGDIKPLFNNFMWYIYYDTYGNRYDPFIDLSIYGNRLYLDFTIEDVNTPIVPDLVEINGVDVTSYIDVNGHIDGISEYGLNTIHIESSGYRDKDIQLYLYDDRSYNISLISEENSGDVQFSFKYPDLTTVNTKRFEVYDTNTNQLVGSDYTTSTGYVEFALDSAQAYYEFRLIYNDTNDENYYSYVAKPVTVKVPLNESDGTTLITPFDISVEGLGVADYLGVTTDTNVLIITNTVSKYTFIITPDLNYCSRTYNISIPGDPDAYILQPYLVDTDNCSQVYMYTYNKATSQPIGGVDIYIYRQIPGYAVQLVEFLTTDDTGIGISNLYAYKSYTIKLFYDNIEITNYDLVISNARYNFYLDLSGTSTGTTEEQNIYNIEFSDFDGNTPNGYLYKTDLNTIRFWQDITVENGSFYENTIYNIQVISDNNTLLDKSYNMTEGHTLYTTNDILDFSLFDSTGMSYTKLCGTIYVDGESVYNICANFIVKDSSYWNLSGDLKNFLNTLSTFQKVLFMVIIMLIFITITAVFTKDSFVIFFIGAGILGFFEFIIGDTAMITVWAIGVLGGAALLIWKNGLR